jgi:putative DNA primase/helicase
VPLGSKNPNRKGWEDLRLGLQDLGRYFPKSLNVGVLLGVSNALVDIDIDALNVLDLVDRYMPPTGRIFGRPSKPASHRLYIAPGAETVKFSDPIDNEMLVELRSTGCQTVFPPSTHESGELIAWRERGETATVAAADITSACTNLAIATLIRKHLPDREAELLSQEPPAWTGALGKIDRRLEHTARKWLGLPYRNGEDHAPPRTTRAAAEHHYVRAAIDREIETLRGTGKGSRNDQLNRCAFSLAQWIASGAVTASWIETTVLGIAREIGYVADDGEQAAVGTIASGIRAGSAEPREVPADEPRRHGKRSTEGDQTAERPNRRLRALTAGELLTMDIPAREMLLDPIVPAKGTVLLYSKRGVGKTFVGLFVAYAVASGGTCLRWKAPKPRRVLVIDGEMPLVTLRERLARIADSSEIEPPSPDYIRIIAADHQENGIPDLASAEGIEAIEEHLEGIELVIVDNLSTLYRFGKENEGESWAPIQEWALSLRRRGISVLFIHHAGKGGAQRGTSKREDVLDSVIVLRHPDDYSPAEGARFEVHLEKGRGIYGDAAKPFEAKLEITNDKMVWTMRDLEDAEARRAADLKAEGLSIRDIGQEMGTSKSRVDRLLKKAAEMRAEE